MVADKSRLTLSQAVLAPISSILQAQVHASRSFLKLVFQMGFKHKPVDDKGNTVEPGADQTFDLYTSILFKRNTMNTVIRKNSK